MGGAAAPRLAPRARGANAAVSEARRSEHGIPYVNALSEVQIERDSVSGGTLWLILLGTAVALLRPQVAGMSDDESWDTEADYIAPPTPRNGGVPIPLLQGAHRCRIRSGVEEHRKSRRRRAIRASAAGGGTRAAAVAFGGGGGEVRVPKRCAAEKTL